jgi:hypothetical protein
MSGARVWHQGYGHRIKNHYDVSEDKCETYARKEV